MKQLTSVDDNRSSIADTCKCSTAGPHEWKPCMENPATVTTESSTAQ